MQTKPLQLRGFRRFGESESEAAAQRCRS
jgi:hypothetical protein